MDGFEIGNGSRMSGTDEDIIKARKRAGVNPIEDKPIGEATRRRPLLDSRPQKFTSDSIPMFSEKVITPEVTVILNAILSASKLIADLTNLLNEKIGKDE